MTELIKAVADVIRPYMQETTETGTVAQDVAVAAEAHFRPVVTTAAELNALPEGVVILSEQGGVFGRALDGPGAVWRELGFRANRWPEDISLPARVLFRPEVTP